MPLDPKFDVLLAAQRELWPALGAAQQLGFVLYGGTALALQLGHRQSVDFDFFRTEALGKPQLRDAFSFLRGAAVLQDAPNTLAVLANLPSGTVKVSFFGNLKMGRIADPLKTRDGTLLVATMDDLMATKLKAILDRAEAKDYRDIAAMLAAGVSLSKGLAGFRAMFGGEPIVALKALGFFEDGDLSTLPETDKALLRSARDQVRGLPEVSVRTGLLAAGA
jgi:hypothetical protein